MKKILIVVDYQYDFASPEGNLSVSGADTIVDNIQNLINDKSFDNIIYTMDTHNLTDYNNSEEGKLFPIHCEFNTPGWDFYKIKPRNNSIKTLIEEGVMEKTVDFSINEEYVFIKDKFSIWEGNQDYEEFFLSKFDKNTEIVICGVALDVCVFEHAKGLINRGFRNVTIKSEAVKGITEEGSKKCEIVMKNDNIIFS